MNSFDEVMASHIFRLKNIIEELNTNIPADKIKEISGDSTLCSLIDLAELSVVLDDTDVFIKILQTICLWGYHLGSRK